MIRRDATPADAPQMRALLYKIIAAGNTTAHATPFDAPGFARAFTENPFGISLVVAEDGGVPVGFQCLEWADPGYMGEHVLPAGWALIASYVATGSQTRGIGSALMAETLAREMAADVTRIDATVRRHNARGMAFYRGQGFAPYRHWPDAVSLSRTPR